MGADVNSSILPWDVIANKTTIFTIGAVGNMIFANCYIQSDSSGIFDAFQVNSASQAATLQIYAR